MMKKISIETVASGVCITGDISAVLSNRRASRLLKDTLDCEILESKIMIKNKPNCSTMRVSGLLLG